MTTTTTAATTDAGTVSASFDEHRAAAAVAVSSLAPDIESVIDGRIAATGVAPSSGHPHHRHRSSLLSDGDGARSIAVSDDDTCRFDISSLSGSDHGSSSSSSHHSSLLQSTINSDLSFMNSASVDGNFLLGGSVVSTSRCLVFTCASCLASLWP